MGDIPFLYRQSQRSPLQNQKVISHHLSSSHLSTATYPLQNQKVVSRHLSSSHLSTATYSLQKSKGVSRHLSCHISPLLLTFCKIKTWSVVITNRHISPLLLTSYKNQKRSVVIPHRHISPLLLTYYKIKRWEVVISSNNPFYIFFIDIELQCLEALSVALFNESIPSRSHGCSKSISLKRKIKLFLSLLPDIFLKHFCHRNHSLYPERNLWASSNHTLLPRKRKRKRKEKRVNCIGSRFCNRKPILKPESLTY